MKNEEYKKLSIAEFTKAAGRYESNHAGIYEMCKKDYPDILEELEKEPFRDLLDAGCGPAPMISLLAEKYPDRHYTGLDLTPAMIEQAKKKNIPNATFVVGDCENFPFENDSFDVIICSMSFHHYPNPQAFFDSVKRCLRPNGRLILIAVFDCRKSVCDDNESPSCNKLCDRILQNSFILRICVCSRLVKNNNWRIFKHSSCNRNTLSLTS